MTKNLDDLLRLGNKNTGDYDLYNTEYYEEGFQEWLIEAQQLETNITDEDTERSNYYHHSFINQLEHDFTEFMDMKRKVRIDNSTASYFVKEFINKEDEVINEISNRHNLSKKDTVSKMLISEKGEFEPRFEKEVNWNPYLEKYGFSGYDRYVLFRWLKHYKDKVLSTIREYASL